NSSKDVGVGVHPPTTPPASRATPCLARFAQGENDVHELKINGTHTKVGDRLRPGRGFLRAGSACTGVHAEPVRDAPQRRAGRSVPCHRARGNSASVFARTTRISA